MPAIFSTFEFHIARTARDRYAFDEALFGLTGNVVFANIQAARVFAQKMNQLRDLKAHPELAIKAGDLNAMGLIDEILHFVAGLYREDVDSSVMGQALAALEKTPIGRERLDATLRRFAIDFPTLAVYRNRADADEYLRGETAGIPNREVVLEELMLLWLANVNPAFEPFRELFDDADLRENTDYVEVVAELHRFFDTKPVFGPDHQNLIDMLRSPAVAVPDSLEGQLAYIRQRWFALLGKHFLSLLLSGADLLSEEQKLVFLGPGAAEVYDYTLQATEVEAYSSELDWMPSIMLMAKNVYVWLDQLSRRYGRHIGRLDEIPDAELDQLARWGFTGLWLIGVWERSAASQRIKQLTGNPEAVPSAYSLYDYVIANDLGGQEAYDALRKRAWERRIRMASDMVPNHVGIMSRWVVEHPDWFVSLDGSPYPWYTFNGADLSTDERVGVFVEDHYYDHTDAAVVFKRVDRWTGREQYVYHGNDGTSMPWNDTAQLNYLNPEVREAVIQTILHVARQFPVIRFDAAMTLTKRHYQRLWFPDPGTGGAIPTRAEFGLNADQFNAAMPHEFWREVVDRVAAEAPDTLLLAEAFWLLEGYFVRTLGMHRVYNSAFMNMLRDEENAKYRQVMKNTLEFDPEVLRRFVNFMSNPDERTAVDQFGSDDKYFGVATLMITMPGLPMFGHGQVEGFTEKYGMEYRRAYFDEIPNERLIRQHEREIFPLVRRRRLFAGIEQFRLYDFFRPDGQVNEDVFAYSNRLGDDRALVIYQNAFAETAGWVRTSVGFVRKTGEGDDKTIVQSTLAEGLGLAEGEGWFSIFRDQVTGLEYIRSNQELRDQGLFVELHAYKRHVFTDFRDLRDDGSGRLYQLTGMLNGRGVGSMDEALRELELRPVLSAVEELLAADALTALVERPLATGAAHDEGGGGNLEGRIWRLAEACARVSGRQFAVEAAARGALRDFERLIPSLQRPDGPAVRAAPEPEAPGDGFFGTRFHRASMLGWLALGTLTRVLDEDPAAAAFDRWLVDRSLLGSFHRWGLGEDESGHALDLARSLLRHEAVATAARDAGELLAPLFDDPDGARFLGVNRHGEAVWFNKERFESLIGALRAVRALREQPAPPPAQAPASAARAATDEELFAAIGQAAEQSGWQVDALLRAARAGAVRAE